MKEKKTKVTKVTGVRLTKPERDKLRKIGGGSLSDAIRQGLELLFKQHRVKTA